jgi:hypothetical protein
MRSIPNALNGVIVYANPQIEMNPLLLLGCPRFGILTNPYPNQFGDSRSNMGIGFFGVFSVTHKIGFFSPKIKAIPMPWCTSSCQKFRKPTHCARKSRIRQTREGAASQGAASPHVAY